MLVKLKTLLFMGALPPGCWAFGHPGLPDLGNVLLRVGHRRVFDQPWLLRAAEVRLTT